MKRLLAASLFLALSCLGALAQTISCPGPTGGNCIPVLVMAPAAGAAGYPSNATPVAASATGTTAGATATLAAAAGKFTYLCGFHAEVGSATAAIPVNVTATGLTGGTFTSSANAPVTAATATAGPIISQVFTPCVPSSAVNTGIAVAAGALGAGGVNQNVNAWGYQQ